MRRLLLLIFAFVSFVGINVGRAQSALPYEINFADSQEGWTAVDNSPKPGTTWTYKPKWAYIQGVYYGSIVMTMDYSSTSDDYYVSPAFNLEAGKKYTAEFNLCSQADGEPCTVTFERGTSDTDMSTFSKVADVVLNDNSEYPAAQKVQVEVEEDGSYHFAFHNVAPPFNGTVFIFEFKLYEDGGSVVDPEDPVKEVPYSVNLTTDYKEWTAVDNNKDSHTWTPMSGFGPMLEMPLTGQNDDDYFSPQIILKGGVTYKITTNVAVQGIPKGYDIITLTQGTDKTLMTPVKQLTLENSGENVEVAYFTPETDGNYYFSFHNTSESGGNTLQLYSFAIEENKEDIPSETEIYSTDFTGADPLNGWTVVDTNADGVKWAMIDGYNGPSYDGNTAAGAANDWLITPALNMEAGSDYLIRYTVSQAGAFDADELNVKWGTSPTAEGMTNILATESINLNSGSVDKIIRMTCTESTTAYIGFNIATAAPNGILSVNKISVTKTSKAQPKSVENLEVSSSFSNKSVTLKWKNPSYDVTDAPILSTLNISIYENGVKVATLEDRELGAADSYTYNPETFGGTARFMVVASVDGVESLPVEQVINLEDVQGEAVAVREFMTAGDYSEWVVENKDGGNTWQAVTYGDGGMTVNRGSKDMHNDWAITPGVTLEPGKRYVVKFRVSTSTNYEGTLKVWLGDSQTSESMTRELISLDDIRYNGFVKTSTPQFSVDKEGVYYLAFQDCKTTNMMTIKSVGIYYIDGDDKEVPVVELPYTENFDSYTTTPEGWKMDRSSEQYGFWVEKVADVSSILGVKAYSGANALFAAGGAPEAREEVVYTPKFSLQPGKTYTVSFMLNMLQRGTNNKVALYKATDQSLSALDGEPLMQTEESTNLSWVKKSVDVTVDEAGDYCFAIKVNTDGAEGGEIIIDDFSVEESVVIVPVKPAAVTNVRAMAVNSNKNVIFHWSHPLVDAEGKPIQKGSVIKTQIYDGDELIVEHSETMPDPATLDPNTGLEASYSYQYVDGDKFAGQKIYKFVPSIETEVGQATSCVLSISSFTDGYLKERAYVADFSEGENEWNAIDADKDGNTWTSADASMATNGKDEWLISPEIALDPTKSYYVLCEFKTDFNQSADITFTRGNGQSVDDQTEVIGGFKDVIMNDYNVMEIGTTFTPESEGNFFGIHVESPNGAKVQIKSLKVMRLFTSAEPEELPYTQDFENRIDIDEKTLFANKWGCRTSSSELFRITKMPENTVAAHSGEYAAVANEYSLNGRTELLYTPYFTLKQGETYEISFYLYMPGNGENKTTANVVLAYTQDESGLELPILYSIKDPVTEWTKFTVKYEPTYDMDYCFYFEFTADAPNAGMIALDDFKIENVTSTGIKENVESSSMHYDASTSTLYLRDDIKSVSIYNVQGQNVLNAHDAAGSMSLSGLGNGIYIVKALTSDGKTLSMKLVKK